MENTIEQLHKKLTNGSITSVSLVTEYLERAKEKNPEFNMYREIFNDAITQAEKADQIIKQGKATMLTGIPVALKDNILFDGHQAGASSKILEGYIASYDATVVSALKEVGAVLIGRTNMDEFAMGSSTENSAYGPTKNPLDSSRVPGGSSGGSAAVVAADVAVVSLGSDTGGSIRQPASFCGIVGLLPTYGTVARHGLMALGSSLDVIGPFAKSVSDAEILYNTIAVYSEKDGTSIPKEKRVASKELKKKIGVPWKMFEGGGIDAEVIENFKSTLKKLEAEGYTIEEVDLPTIHYSLAVYYILMPAEASSNLARFDGVRYGPRIEGKTLFDLYTKTKGRLFGAEPRRRILLGTYVLSHGYYDSYYGKALKLREKIRLELENVLTKYDAILTPTTPSVAFKIGEKANDPLAMYLSDLFTVPANIAQLPALSVPSGKNSEGMPFGVQLIGERFAEEKLFALGKVIESIR